MLLSYASHVGLIHVFQTNCSDVQMFSQRTVIQLTIPVPSHPLKIVGKWEPMGLYTRSSTVPICFSAPQQPGVEKWEYSLPSEVSWCCL